MNRHTGTRKARRKGKSTMAIPDWMSEPWQIVMMNGAAYTDPNTVTFESLDANNPSIITVKLQGAPWGTFDSSPVQAQDATVAGSTCAPTTPAGQPFHIDYNQG